MPPPQAFEQKRQLSHRQLRGLWHQLTQHLIDLGYIAEQTFRDYWVHKKVIIEQPDKLEPIIKGVRQYLDEEQAPNIRRLEKSYDETGAISRIWIEEHLGIITEAISKYTSFDGTLRPPSHYEVGEVSCYGRSLAFRMRVIFEMDQSIDQLVTFTKSELRFVHNLKFNTLKSGLEKLNLVQTGETLISEGFWKLVSDIDLLFQVFLASLSDLKKNRAYALAYDYDLDNGVGQASNFRLIISKRRERNLFGNSPKWNVRRIRRAEEMTTGFHPLIATRILQIKLWQTSFYKGAIDGEWGSISHNAALAAKEQEIQCLKESKDARDRSELSIKTVKRCIFCSHKKQIVAIDFEDLYRVLCNYCSSNEDSGNDLDAELDLMNTLVNDFDLTEDEVDQAILTEKNLSSMYPDDSLDKKLKRRVSYPSQNNGSFFKGLLRGVKRIAQWIKRAVRKVLGIIFAFAKVMLDRVRKGVQLFCQGFRYISYLLLGRPIVTPEMAHKSESKIRLYSTRFRIDFDAVNAIPKDFTKKGLAAHRQTLLTMQKSMLFFIDVVTFVIRRISEIGSPGGWVKLGIYFFRLIFVELKKRVLRPLSI